jgi:hypothetical protein
MIVDKKKIREKPGAATPWSAINQLLAPEERYHIQMPGWQGFILAPQHVSRLTALLYLLDEEGIPFQSHGLLPKSDLPCELIVSVRAFSRLSLNDDDILEVEGGCSFSLLHSYLFERKCEILIGERPLATDKALLVEAVSSGEKLLEKDIFMGLEFVDFKGCQVRWGGKGRSPAPGPQLHQLIPEFKDFPGIIVKLFLKTLAAPDVRFKLAWPYRDRTSLQQQIHALKDFSTSWEKMECLIPGDESEKGYIIAQISGTREEMEAFQQKCPGYQDASQQDERSQFNAFFINNDFHACEAADMQMVRPDEYLWIDEKNRRTWIISRHASHDERVILTPEWQMKIKKAE